MKLYLSDKTYDLMKFITQIILPALGTLYFSLAGIWDLPNAEEVVGTVVAVDTFLGVCLQLSSSVYANSEERFDGAINVVGDTPEKKTFQLEFDGDPAELDRKNEITLKVNRGA